YYKQNNVLTNCKEKSKYLFNKLQEMKKEFQSIKEVRGKGLLIGLELIFDRNKNIHFSSKQKASKELNEIIMENGGVLYPGSRTKRNGNHGEHIIIAPPLIIKENEIDELIK